ncbi:hypothetical protein [Persicobacter psychrovividus]|uniref:hypothetical protein n=1 Tax=Persicobacter psychrovividus TaxID=387638 RepID=UPI0030CA48C4
MKSVLHRLANGNNFFLENASSVFEKGSKAINQEQPNIGAAIIEAFAYIGGSVLITLAI